MDYPLNQIVYVDAITTSPSTGAAVDADSTPTFEVFEDGTDTDIGVGTTMTKRTSKTGNYRCTFVASAANGFEVGKLYTVVGSATVGGISGKSILEKFRIGSAENTTGVYPVDAVRFNNSATAASNLAAAGDLMVQGTAQTGTLSTTQATTNLADTTVDLYKDRLIVWRSGILIREAKTITAYDGAGKLTFGAFTGAPANGDTFLIV